ncbi:MAG: hypothetical protein HZB53_14040 [Chloroflexi bacterium]|nr:hypothetical protein [Chloroflexota bacterium]
MSSIHLLMLYALTYRVPWLLSLVGTRLWRVRPAIASARGRDAAAPERAARDQARISSMQSPAARIVRKE